MLSTITFAIDNTKKYSVVAQISCTRIEVRENFNSANPPTQDLQQYGVSPASTAAAVAKGTSAIFSRGTPYAAGDVAGYINTASGSITVAQFDHGRI